MKKILMVSIILLTMLIIPVLYLISGLPLVTKQKAIKIAEYNLEGEHYRLIYTDLTNVNKGLYLRPLKEELAGTYYWQIGYLNKENSLLVYYIIDAKSGKVIEESFVETEY